MNESEGKSAVEVRTGIGAEILIAMDNDDFFPLPNKYVLAEKAVMVFQDETSNYIHELEELNFQWRMNKGYFINHLSNFRELLRQKHGKYFEFVRDDGDFTGGWRVVGKREYTALMDRELVGLETRADTFNKRVIDGSKKWKLAIPVVGLERKLIQGNLFTQDAP